MKKLILLITLFVVSTTIQASQAIGINVKKNPLCTDQEFSYEITNYRGVNLVKPIKTNEIATSAVINYTASFNIPYVAGDGSVKSLVRDELATSTLYYEQLVISKLDSSVILAQTPALQNIRNSNIVIIKATLADNGGCAIYAGFSIPAQRLTNTDANYPGLENYLQLPYVRSLMPTGTTKVLTSIEKGT